MPEPAARPVVWLFDVDGCLIDSLTGTSLRPLAGDVLRALRGGGHTVVVWSAGGAAHAERVVTPHGVADAVAAFYDKGERDAAGRWHTGHLAAHHRPDVCVDDRPEDAPHDVEVIAVSPYLAPDRHDRGLESLLAAVTAQEGAELGAATPARVTLRP